MNENPEHTDIPMQQVCVCVCDRCVVCVKGSACEYQVCVCDRRVCVSVSMCLCVLCSDRVLSQGVGVGSWKLLKRGWLCQPSLSWLHME